MYTAIKHLHLTIIVLTFVFFLISFILTMMNSEHVKNKVLKIGPHILYTLFVLTFIYLSYSNPLELYPFVNGWASSKLAGFVIYVLSITLALKWAKNNIWRVVGFISAVFWLAMTARLGFADHIKVKGITENAGTAMQNMLETLRAFV